MKPLLCQGTDEVCLRYVCGSGPVSTPKTAFLRSPQHARRYPPVKRPADPSGKLCQRELPRPSPLHRMSSPRHHCPRCSAHTWRISVLCLVPPNLRFDSDMADLVSPLNGDRDDNYHTRSLLTRSNLLLQSVQYLRLQGQYQLILPVNANPTLRLATVDALAVFSPSLSYI